MAARAAGRAARLTVAALGDAAAGHLRDSLRAVPSFTLFFVREGLAFIGYVVALPVPELVHSVGRFERAMWLARFELHRGRPRGAGRWRIATAADVAALERSTTTWPPSP